MAKPRFAPSPLRGEGWGEGPGLQGARPKTEASSFQRKLKSNDFRPLQAQRRWIPVFAGMTSTRVARVIATHPRAQGKRPLRPLPNGERAGVRGRACRGPNPKLWPRHSSESWNPVTSGHIPAQRRWIPAFAGMTGYTRCARVAAPPPLLNPPLRAGEEAMACAVRTAVTRQRRGGSCRSSCAIPSGRSGAPRCRRCPPPRSPACPSPRTRRSPPCPGPRKPAPSRT